MFPVIVHTVARAPEPGDVIRIPPPPPFPVRVAIAPVHPRTTVGQVAADDWYEGQAVGHAVVHTGPRGSTVARCIARPGRGWLARHRLIRDGYPSGDWRAPAGGGDLRIVGLAFNPQLRARRGPARFAR